MISINLGEFSQFHNTFKYYIDGVSLNTPKFPDDWEDRLMYIKIEDCEIFFPSLEDLACSKYAAFREKDLSFIKKLWQDNLLDANLVRDLVFKLPVEKLDENIEFAWEKFNTILEQVEDDIKNFTTSHGPQQ